MTLVHRQSLFSRVTRYARTAARNPAEDRLTEITAGVLERVDGLARHIVLRSLDPSVSVGGECGPAAAPETTAAREAVRSLGCSTAIVARTQVHVRDLDPEARGGRVDLELRFHEGGPASRTVAVVWVEVKHGIEPHSGQLHTYVEQRPKTYPGAVVLLAPRSQLPAAPGECPAAVSQRSWQATARAAASFEPASDVERWLLSEWLAYLREEKLMDLEALGPEHLTALAYGREAHVSLERVIEAAHDRIARSLQAEIEVAPPPTGRKRLEYWECWDMPEPSSGSWDGAWFDWMVAEARDSFAHDLPGRVFVMAGLSKESGEEFEPTLHDALESGLEDAAGSRLVFHRWKGDYERLQRVAYPQDVLRGETLQEQGESLGRWVIETFKTLERRGPLR